MADEESKTFVIDADDAATETKVEVTVDTKESKAADTKPDDSPDTGLEDMRRQVEEAREARLRAEAAAQAAQEQAQRRLAAQQQAERLAAQRAQEVQQVRRSADDAEFAAITNALQNAEKTREALQAQYAALTAESNWADASKVNAELGEISARIVALKDGKAAAERRAQKSEDTSSRTEAPAPYQQQLDPRSQQDAWLAEQDPYNAAWIRQNRDRFFGDSEFQRKAVAASGYAISNMGLKVGSAEYYRFIDESVGLRKPEPAAEERNTNGRRAPETDTAPRTDARSSAAETTARSSPTPAAPPSRTLPSGGRQQVQITLTAAERAHARATLTKDIIGDKDPEAVFAQHKAKLMAEGRWSGESF